MSEENTASQTIIKGTRVRVRMGVPLWYGKVGRVTLVEDRFSCPHPFKIQFEGVDAIPLPRCEFSEEELEIIPEDLVVEGTEHELRTRIAQLQKELVETREQYEAKFQRLRKRIQDSITLD